MDSSFAAASIQTIFDREQALPSLPSNMASFLFGSGSGTSPSGNKMEDSSRPKIRTPEEAGK